ncbi:MAG: glycoside hydrolase family 25 protein [Bacillota bacterium]|nr:glycoside hydrolase family 25 protein [Bacillota bacterium]
MNNKYRNRLAFSLLLNIIFGLALIIAVIALLALPRSEQSPLDPEQDYVSVSRIQQAGVEHGASVELMQALLDNWLVYRSDGQLVFQPLDSSVPLHDYDWNNLSHGADGDIDYYYSDGSRALKGVDVSVYQGDIDWEAVAADGIDFAMLRAGYRGYGSGALAEDEKFAANIAGATAAGLPVGAYFFSQAVSVEEMEQEVQMLLKAVEGYDIAYPLVLDMEEIYGQSSRIDGLSREQATELAQTFIKLVEEAGYQPMIYGNIKWLAARLDIGELDGAHLWLAQYYQQPLFPYLFTIWQFSQSGQVDGIDHAVDLNICFYDYAAEQ